MNHVFYGIDNALFTLYSHHMNAVLLSKDVRYPFTIFLTDSTGIDYFRLSWKQSENSSYDSSWDGMLYNLEEGILSSKYHFFEQNAMDNS